MKFATSLSLTALFASLVTSADVPQSQIDFLTALVSDYQGNVNQYIQFFATAKDVPSGLGAIATKVLTYTDDSYTTILENLSIDVDAIESYATELPWYTRLQEAVGEDASGSDSGSASETGSASKSNSNSASGSGSGSGSGSASGSASGSSSVKATSASSSSSASATSSGTSDAGANGIIAPVGAALGALAIALM